MDLINTKANLPNDIDHLECKINHLLNLIEEKNISLNDLNIKNQNLLKENEEIKLMISNECNDQLSELKNLIKNSNNANEMQMLQTIDSIITNIQSSKLAVRSINKENDKILFEMIDSKSKLFKYINELSLLKNKNEIFEKMIQTKNNHINDLRKYNDEQREKYQTNINTMRDECNTQTATINTMHSELNDLKLRNEQLEKQNEELIGKLNEIEQNDRNILEECKQKYESKQRECEHLTKEIEKLNDIFEKSKIDMLEGYLEKFYPNIKLLNQMFEPNRSISQLYSKFLQTETLNKNLLIEKDVLNERCQTLSNQLNEKETAAINLTNEIKRLKCFEDEMSKIENENKELKISLKFYQNSVHSLYNGGKILYDSFQKLSAHLNQLVRQQTNQQINDENMQQDTNTGMMAVKYVMELQNKFQEYNQIHLEFEKNKLNFINDKQNFLENENQIDALNQRVQMLELLKKQIQTEMNALKSENDLLKSIMTNKQNDYENEITKMNDKIVNLSTINQSLDESKKSLEVKLNQLLNDIEIKELEHKELSNQLEIKTKQLELNEKCLMAKTKQIEQLNDVNKNLQMIKNEFEKSTNVIVNNLYDLFEEKNDYRNRLIRMEIESNQNGIKEKIFEAKQAYYSKNLRELNENYKYFDKFNSIISDTKSLINNNNQLCKTEIDMIKQQLENDKRILNDNLLRLQNDLRNEIDRNIDIENRFISQFKHQNSSNTNNDSNNGLLVERLEMITKELNDFKHKYQILFEEKQRLQLELNQMAKIKRETDSNAENINKNNSNENITQSMDLNKIIETKNLSIDLLEKRLKIIENTVKELEMKLSEKNEKYHRLQQDYRNLCLIKINDENLRTKFNEFERKAQECDEQKKLLEQKLIQMKIDRNRMEKSNDNNSKLLHSDNQRLLSDKFELMEMNSILNNDIQRLTSSCKINDDDHIQTLIKNITNNNKLLLNKIKMYDLQLNDMKLMQTTIDNLEKCIENEKENSKQLNELLSQKSQNNDISNLNEELLTSIQTTRQENEELMEKCVRFCREIENLKNQEQVIDKTLQIKLQQAETNKQELLSKLNESNVKFQKIENELKELMAKFTKQTSELEQLSKESAEMNEKSEKESEKMKNELTSLQTMNQQLKNLARKYKSQCEQYQKQQQQSSSNVDVQQRQQLAMEQKIKALSDENEKLCKQIEQLESELAQSRDNFEQSKQKIRTIGQQAKNRIINLEQSLNERQKHIDYLQSLVKQNRNQSASDDGNGEDDDDDDNEIDLKINKQQSSNVGPSVSSSNSGGSHHHYEQQKQQQQPSTSFSLSTLTTSSTATMTASKTLNLLNRNRQLHNQPSSSSGSNNDNDVDNNRLQSAHISSHTSTSMMMIDENSMESSSSSSFFMPTNIPSTSSSMMMNKRRLQNDSNEHDNNKNHGNSANNNNCNKNITNTNDDNGDNDNNNHKEKAIKIAKFKHENSENIDMQSSSAVSEHQSMEHEMMEEAQQSSSTDDDAEHCQHNEQEQIVDQSHQQLEPEEGDDDDDDNDNNNVDDDEQEEEEDHHTESNDASYPDHDVVVDATSSDNNDDNQ